ncbi:MAG: DUF6166 domain-containing protein [Gammaproteobacteria bacterium]|jgi:Family of unknown function (DUF6166)
MSKVYRGRRVRWGPMVEVDGKPLLPRYDLRHYARMFTKQPTGSAFSWGDASPGSAQLALALLADCLGDDAKAIDLHMAFRVRCIDRLPHSGWRLTEERLRAMIADLACER